MMFYKVKKKFGQHFLQDENVLKAIVDSAELHDGDIVWEIGAGLGALTDQLLKHNIDLTIFEIDNDLIPILQKKYADRCKIIHGDILKVINHSSLLTPHSSLKIVTNLPYQISSPFLYKITENYQAFSCIVVMLQKEVAKRLSALPGKKDYGVLSIKAQFYFAIKYLFEVSRDKFSPPPEVDSAVLKLIPRKEVPIIEDIKLFWELVEISFRNRRKTLRNNLKNWQLTVNSHHNEMRLSRLTVKNNSPLNPPSERGVSHAMTTDNFCHDNMLSCPIDLTRRGETLSEEEFIILYRYMLQ
jgi:16S rRNA (adenine1518-N6/adenine1519-N6)-dimethyltransferase